jgi:hypothetical protein
MYMYLGRMLWFKKHFREKIGEKIALFAQTTASFFCWQKSQKIVIITSTPACLWDTFCFVFLALRFIAELQFPNVCIAKMSNDIVSSDKGWHKLRIGDCN